MTTTASPKTSAEYKLLDYKVFQTSRDNPALKLSLQSQDGEVATVTLFTGTQPYDAAKNKAYEKLTSGEFIRGQWFMVGIKNAGQYLNLESMDRCVEPANATASAPAPVRTSIDGARWGNNLNNSTLVNVNVPPEKQAAVWDKILSDAAWLYSLTAEDIAGFRKDVEPEEPEAEPEEPEVPQVSFDPETMRHAVSEAANGNGSQIPEMISDLGFTSFDEMDEDSILKLIENLKSYAAENPLLF